METGFSEMDHRRVGTWKSYRNGNYVPNRKDYFHIVRMSNGNLALSHFHCGLAANFVDRQIRIKAAIYSSNLVQ